MTPQEASKGRCASYYIGRRCGSALLRAIVCLPYGTTAQLPPHPSVLHPRPLPFSDVIVEAPHARSTFVQNTQPVSNYIKLPHLRRLIIMFLRKENEPLEQDIFDALIKKDVCYMFPFKKYVCALCNKEAKSPNGMMDHWCPRVVGTSARLPGCGSLTDLPDDYLVSCWFPSLTSVPLHTYSQFCIFVLH